jgi:hypothetical protein
VKAEEMLELTSRPEKRMKDLILNIACTEGNQRQMLKEKVRVREGRKGRLQKEGALYT